MSGEGGKGREGGGVGRGKGGGMWKKEQEMEHVENTGFLWKWNAV